MTKHRHKRQIAGAKSGAKSGTKKADFCPHFKGFHVNYARPTISCVKSPIYIYVALQQKNRQGHFKIPCNCDDPPQLRAKFPKPAPTDPDPRRHLG